MNVLEVKDIYKKIGDKNIVNGISFSLKAGEIFGFIGPNGAGKTTTIRMLVGLIKPTSGSIKIMGHDIQNAKLKALGSVGCIVENPDMYNDLTGIQNLRFYADIYGNISKERIVEIIDIIGLKDRINDKVKKYSLGMKQRLGLGQAILANPKLLILDEPTNGLDPVGIYDFREIIKKFAKENNSTVFISSHNLSEIEQLCDRFAFIKEGVINSIEDMSLPLVNIEKLKISTRDQDTVIKFLSGISFVDKIELNEDKDIIFEVEIGFFPKLIELFGKNNIIIDDISKVRYSLEHKFLEIMKG